MLNLVATITIAGKLVTLGGGAEVEVKEMEQLKLVHINTQADKTCFTQQNFAVSWDILVLKTVT